MSKTNPNYLDVLKATPEEQKGLFLESANRIGVPLGYIEKDF